jgi:soluble lytic murein transglycosylase
MQFQVILTSIALVAGLTLPAAAFAKLNVQAKPNADTLVQDMAEAYKKSDSKRLADLLPRVQGHVLEPWAAYWELSARLEGASPNEIRIFLTRYADTYQEDRLRNDWLLVLGKRRDWDTFLAEYPKFRMDDDPEVQCYALQAGYSTSGADVADQVQALWLSQRDPDEGCAAAAEQQIKVEHIDTLVAWRRARLGFEFDKPRIAVQAVNLLNPDWAGSINTIFANPARYLDEKFVALRPRTRELVTLALIRLASNDYQAAAEEVNKLRWRAQLTQEERSWVWGVIGKRAARALSDKALGYYVQGKEEHMHSDHLVWKARAALRAGDWQQVQDAISTLSESQLRDPTWVYWRARALQALKVPNAELRARTLLQSIASHRGFYEQLALEELGGRISVPPQPEPLSEEEKQAALNNDGLKRALYAIKIGLRSDGVREWNYSTNLHQKGGMSDRELLAAANLACEQHVWDRCISASERTKSVADFAQRFPTPYRQEVSQRASRSGLDPAYVYGLIRQESRFIADAQSNVGAAGLMQVLPSTARWTARRIGLNNFKPRQIAERETNITIGTSYLKLVLDSFDGSIPLATAAYNAGPTRSRMWRGQSGDPVLEAAIWMENIPFPETRDYVKKVMANTTNYAALLSGEPQSLKAQLGFVGPLGVDKPEPEEQLP